MNADLNWKTFQWIVTEAENKPKWHDHDAEQFLSALNLILFAEIGVEGLHDATNQEPLDRYCCVLMLT